MEQTFLMVKPDGVQRGLIGEIVKRFEQKGLQLIGGKLIVITQEQAAFHYAEHEGKPFLRPISEIYYVWTCFCDGMARGSGY